MNLKPLLIFLFVFPLLLILGFLFFIQLSSFQADKKAVIPIANKQKAQIRPGDSLSVLLWNISYAGMPESMDFFYSGGINLKPNKELVKLNFEHILQQLSAFETTTDIFLLHKVDSNSKRSNYMNQNIEIAQRFPQYESSFCINFSNPFIPVPLNEPIGEVHAGMMSLSRKKAAFAQRIPLKTPKDYYWPKKLFTAQRCLSLMQFSVGEKELYIINTHLESYDFKGEMRLQQLKIVEELADSLYADGHYVLVAGTWNMNPPGFKKYRIKSGYLAKPAYPEINIDHFFQDWQFPYDKSLPTNRSIKEAYRHGAISTTIKDFFIASPNLIILKSKTIDQQFKFSDHQAVYISVFLL